MKFKWKSATEKTAEAAAAANWNSLVSKIQEANPEAKTEDITPDSILESMEEPTSGGDATELQSKLDAANAKVTEQATTIQKLEGTVADQKTKLGADGASSDSVSKTTDTKVEEEAGTMIVDDAMNQNIEAAKSLFAVLPD